MRRKRDWTLVFVILGLICLAGFSRDYNHRTDWENSKIEIKQATKEVKRESKKIKDEIKDSLKSVKKEIKSALD